MQVMEMPLSLFGRESAVSVKAVLVERGGRIAAGRMNRDLGSDLFRCLVVDGKEYICAVPRFPWEMSGREKALSEEDLNGLFEKYVDILWNGDIDGCLKKSKEGWIPAGPETDPEEDGWYPVTLVKGSLSLCSYVTVMEFEEGAWIDDAGFAQDVIAWMPVSGAPYDPSRADNSPWIPSGSDTDPKEEGWYLAMLDGEICGEEEPFFSMSEFSEDGWVDDDVAGGYKCVLAWMPMPDPYIP